MIKKYQNQIILIILSILSVAFFLYYYTLGITLGYGDDASRLNISRKLFDNLTPGFSQLGNVWLPLPQLIMGIFAWNNFMWHSGIAGSVMSMASYILGGYFIYRAGKLLTNSNIASLLGLSLYALNINILYMQSTAWSESLFIGSLAAVIYYGLAWTHEYNIITLIKLALAINVATLTRYEGLSILLGSIIIVFIYSYIKVRKWSETESNVILYSVLAFLGFGLWTLYLWAIFGDPFYWSHVYAVTSAAPQNFTLTHLSPLNAGWKYLTTSIWMTGLIPAIYGLIGFIIAATNIARTRDFRLLPLLLPFSIFLFIVFAMTRYTVIKQPELNIQNLLSAKTNYFKEFNIRYGLQMVPFFAIFSMYLFRYKSTLFRSFLMLMFGIQIFSYIYPAYALILQLPINFSAEIKTKNYEDVNWLKAHYDGGLILVSTLTHDPQMFKVGYNYSTFIHEGTGRYWKTSIKNPSIFATWVWMDADNPDDPVIKNINNAVLKKSYNLVYKKDGARIYKIKQNLSL